MARTQKMIDADQLVHRKIMKGILKNEDVVLDTTSLKQQKTTFGGGLGGMSAFAWGALGLTWIFNRRNLLKQ